MILLLVGLGSLIVGLAAYRHDRGEHVSAARRRAAETLRLWLEQHQDAIIHPGWSEERAVDEVSSQYAAKLRELQPHLERGLLDRATALASLMELGTRLHLNKDSGGWIQAAWGAYREVTRAAAEQAQGRTAGLSLYPTSEEVARAGW